MINHHLLQACCLAVERRGKQLTQRKFAEAVLGLYLSPATTHLTDEEKTERYERAVRNGTEAVDRFGRKGIK